ncbi:biliverdin-producing heme oxygenase [Frateuria terrea]|uniref:Heme oxygenase n=1 Tax=Frateuria terrea TaxID=529704 RepID=A0A1H6R6G5_9GAMM|nr:biliverdin-producing heme oxygenase [Frateuria terrea]SEI51323.1 Heme oxygenase [Frateuria terrea]SFP16227.1 Heme oxygenase [Frateuria terrea]
MHDPRDAARSHLRAHTSDIHARLETLPVFEPILARRAGWGDYRRLLGAYHDFYTSAWQNLEVGYRELARVGPGVPPRQPLALLDEDLRSVGARARSVRPGAGASATPAQAVGWVWVAEGSALGGVVIDRALDSLFGARREGRRFFEPVSTSGLRWRAVCASIEILGNTKEALGSMTEGARDAFGCIERSLLNAKDDA